MNDRRTVRFLTCVFVTDDRSVVRGIVDRVAVFRRGKIVEIAPNFNLSECARSNHADALIPGVPNEPPRRSRR